MTTTWTLDEHVAMLVGSYIEANGPQDDRDLDLVVDLAHRDFYEREGFRSGWDACWHAIRGASNEISAAVDWREEAITLGHIDRARAFRAAMLRPRANDFKGRRAA